MQRGRTAEQFSFTQDHEIESVEDELSRSDELMSVLKKSLQGIELITSRKKYEFGWQP